MKVTDYFGKHPGSISVKFESIWSSGFSEKIEMWKVYERWPIQNDDNTSLGLMSKNLNCTWVVIEWSLKKFILSNGKTIIWHIWNLSECFGGTYRPFTLIKKSLKTSTRHT